MDAFDSRLSRDAKAELEKLYQKRVESLATGYAQTFDEYRYNVGFLAGISAAVEVLEGVKGDLTKPYLKEVK